MKKILASLLVGVFMLGGVLTSSYQLQTKEKNTANIEIAKEYQEASMRMWRH